MANKFTCAACGETFDKELSDEEAEAQLEDEFPGFTPDDCDIVCDDCFKKIMEQADE